MLYIHIYICMSINTYRHVSARIVASTDSVLAPSFSPRLSMPITQVVMWDLQRTAFRLYADNGGALFSIVDDMDIAGRYLETTDKMSLDSSVYVITNTRYAAYVREDGLKSILWFDAPEMGKHQFSTSGQFRPPLPLGGPFVLRVVQSGRTAAAGSMPPCATLRISWSSYSGFWDVVASCSPPQKAFRHDIWGIFFSPFLTGAKVPESRRLAAVSDLAAACPASVTDDGCHSGRHLHACL